MKRTRKRSPVRAGRRERIPPRREPDWLTALQRESERREIDMSEILRLCRAKDVQSLRELRNISRDLFPGRKFDKEKMCEAVAKLAVEVAPSIEVSVQRVRKDPGAVREEALNLMLEPMKEAVDEAKRKTCKKVCPLIKPSKGTLDAAAEYMTTTSDILRRAKEKKRKSLSKAEQAQITRVSSKLKKKLRESGIPAEAFDEAGDFLSDYLDNSKRLEQTGKEVETQLKKSEESGFFSRILSKLSSFWNWLSAKLVAVVSKIPGTKSFWFMAIAGIFITACLCCIPSSYTETIATWGSWLGLTAPTEKTVYGPACIILASMFISAAKSAVEKVYNLLWWLQLYGVFGVGIFYRFGLLNGIYKLFSGLSVKSELPSPVPAIEGRKEEPTGLYIEAPQRYTIEEIEETPPPKRSAEDID